VERWGRVVLAACYLAMIAVPIQKQLWFDELYTYYIAAAPDLGRMFETIRAVDLNPPVIYLVTRGWQEVAGTGDAVSRIPVSIAFFLAAMGFYSFLKPRMGAAWATAAVLLFWCTPSFRYATELRPYGFVMLFFSLTLVGWDWANGPKRRLALGAMAVGSLGLIFSHVLAVSTLGPILLAEMSRQYRKRRIDWAIWACLLLPLAGMATYIPLMPKVAGEVYPATFQAGPRKVATFFLKALSGMCVPLGIAAVLARFGAKFRWKAAWTGNWDLIWMAAGLLSIPFLINGLTMATHGVFFDRYALATSVTLCGAGAAVLAGSTGFSGRAGWAAVAGLVGFGIWINGVQPGLREQRMSSEPNLTKLRTDLPLVVANGATFLELDHYENGEFARRVYYLTERESAIRLAHTTLFEVLPLLKKHFPIRANVKPYGEFLKTHRNFLLFSDLDWPEEWTGKKLREDGATLTPISGWNSRYGAGGRVYEVRF